MLHTKFQGHRPFGSREEDFLWFLPYMGTVAILVMCHIGHAPYWSCGQDHLTKLSFLHPTEAKNEIWIQSA